MNFGQGLDVELSQDLSQRIVEHKHRFVRMFYGRYRELLPNLIVYRNGNTTSIDFLKVEIALRSNYDVVIGETTKGDIMMLGYVTDTQSSENSALLLESKPLTKDDIHFIIPRELIKDEMKEISYQDDCSTGDFVVLKNKILNYTSDYEIIKHYTSELSELVLSRYSISMQAKINTFFLSDANDETINQLVEALYNGSPYIKVTKLFDPKDNIHTIQNEFMAHNFVELKREYQNKISELNNMLGINSLAVEKSSGVSDTEAKSNRAFTTSNGNIYLSGRNNPLGKLNKRFMKDIEAIYNDVVESEFSRIAYADDTEKPKEGVSNDQL